MPSETHTFRHIRDAFANAVDFANKINQPILDTCENYEFLVIPGDNVDDLYIKLPKRSRGVSL